MRIARFVHPGGMSYGVIEGETIVAIEGQPYSGIQKTDQRWALADVRLLPPTLPSKVVCVGRNYADHAAEHGADVPKEPLLFLKPPSSVIGPDIPILLPPQSRQVEHEAELAIVIGVAAAYYTTRVDRETAKKSIFGYTCANDVTARDLQRSDGQWTRAKGFNTFCPLGPWIATELDVSDVEVRCEVNEEVRQLGRTSQMVFDPPTLVSYVSHVMSLQPGDVILTGTPAGVSPLNNGDLVSVRIGGIGELRNPVMTL